MTHPPPNREQIRLSRVRKGKTIIPIFTFLLHFKLSVCVWGEGQLVRSLLSLSTNVDLRDQKVIRLGGKHLHPLIYLLTLSYLDEYLSGSFCVQGIKQLLGVPWYGPFFDQV